MKVTTPGDDLLLEPENLALASCTVHYFDVLNSRPVQHRVECVIVLNPNIGTPVTSDCADDIEQHRLRCDVADTLGEANKMANRGNFAGARDLLRQTAVRVKGSRVNRQVLAVHLLETLQESLQGIQDKVTYIQHGKSVMQNYAGSHWQQRSNSKPSRIGYMKQRAEQLPTGPPLLAKHFATSGQPSSKLAPPPMQSPAHSCWAPALFIQPRPTAHPCPCRLPQSRQSLLQHTQDEGDVPLLSWEEMTFF